MDLFKPHPGSPGWRGRAKTHQWTRLSHYGAHGFQAQTKRFFSRPFHRSRVCICLGGPRGSPSAIKLRSYRIVDGSSVYPEVVLTKQGAARLGNQAGAFSELQGAWACFGPLAARCSREEQNAPADFARVTAGLQGSQGPQEIAQRAIFCCSTISGHSEHGLSLLTWAISCRTHPQQKQLAFLPSYRGAPATSALVPMSRHLVAAPYPSKWARSGPEQLQQKVLFDHLVGTSLQRLRDG